MIATPGTTILESYVAAPETILRQNPLFESLSDEACAALGTRMEVCTRQRGETIFSYMEDGQALFLVVSGRAKVHLHDEQGRELILADLGPGHLFGEMSVLDDCPRSATVTMAETGEVASLSRDGLYSAIEEHPTVAMAFLQMLSRRLREADQVIFDLAMRDVVDRLARMLLLAAGPKVPGERYAIEGLPAQAEIAARIGASRETISRAVANFRRLGLLSNEGRQLYINEAFKDRYGHLIASGVDDNV
jgi:CRP/FNR family transcriptional regulator, cyclic AMP receptor protein